MTTNARKYAILKQLYHRDAPAGFVQQVSQWVTDNSITQLNQQDKPFNIPYGRAYVGEGHGDNGGNSVGVAWGSTYDGCRTWAIKDNVLTLQIYEGDSLTGARRELRGAWKFEFNFDWTEHPLFINAIHNEWNDFIHIKFEDEIAAQNTQIKARIERELLA